MEEEAAILAVALRLGLVEQHEVIGWADQQIRAADEPSLELIDLACMLEAHPLDVHGKLSSLAPGRSDIDALPAALARYTYRLREDLKLRRVVARAMRGLATEAFFDLPDRLSPMISFDDYYDLAEIGMMGTVAHMDAEVLAFCESFEQENAREGSDMQSRGPEPRSRHPHLRFVLIRGVLLWGLPVALFTPLWRLFRGGDDSDLESLPVYLALFLVGGLVFGEVLWQHKRWREGYR